MSGSAELAKLNGYQSLSAVRPREYFVELLRETPVALQAMRAAQPELAELAELAERKLAYPAHKKQTPVTHSAAVVAIRFARSPWDDRVPPPHATDLRSH